MKVESKYVEKMSNKHKIKKEITPLPHQIRGQVLKLLINNKKN